jgi:lipopolysaccharide transport system permease protein
MLLSAYAAAYALRFPSHELFEMLPGAARWAAPLIGGQLAGLARFGRYSTRSRTHAVAGLAIGTLAGHAFAFSLIRTLQGVSHVAMGFQALLALSFVALSYWTAIQPEAPPEGDLVDAGTEDRALSRSIASLIQYRELIRNLVFKDLKLKYRGSFFGFLWSLVNPLVMILVYLVAFKYIMAVRGEGFVFLLLLGILAWTFFASSAVMGAGGIVDNGGLIKTVYFPRAVLPISTVLFNLAQYLLTIAVFLPLMMLIYRVPPKLPMLLFPVILLFQLAMTIGIALALAAGTAFFRDIRHLLEIALMLMFWTTPIIYDYQAVPAAWRWPILLSPLSPFVLAYQEIFYYGRWPEPAVCAVGVTYAVIAFVGGFALFMRHQHEFLEQI